MNKNAWMIRAGEGGYLVEEFAKGVVTVGWHEAGQITDQSQRDLQRRLSSVFPESKAGAHQNAASVLWRFAHIVKAGDVVITYDPEKREYLVGEVKSGYRFEPKRFEEHPHVRDVVWHSRVSRDRLSVATRNSLGSTLTLFAIPEEALSDLEKAGNPKKTSEVPVLSWTEQRDDIHETNKNVAQESLELVKDRILQLDPDKMQELAAALLRAMGYQTTVSAKGPDRGVDVIASPDGLGFQEPRIKVEVKHRRGTIGAPDIRSFQQTLRGNYKGLYLSTGGFTREAHYEAERAEMPVTLLDVTALARLINDHYDRFDAAGRALIPLVKIYRPT